MLSLLLAVIMILGTLTIGTLSISADAWDGTTATAPAGDGSESNPYQIANAENLAWLSAQVAAGEDYEGKYFLQTADIDLNDKAFTPIGTLMALTEKSTTSGAPMIDEDLTLAFKGTYDGGDFVIKNATIEAVENNVSVGSDFITEVDMIYGAGIFGAAMEATIKNVNAENIVVGSFFGEGDPDAALEDIYSVGVAGVIVGIASNISLDRCTTDADSNAFGAWAAGGMVGFTFRNPDADDGAGHGTVITRCINNAAVASDFVAGGMLGGGAVQEISFCVNNGMVMTYTVKQGETFAGGMMGYGTGLGNPNTDFKYCLNSAEAEIGAISFTEGLSRRRGYTAGILGCEGNDTTTYLFSHCYNLMENFTILDYMVNDADGLNQVLTGAILGQIKGSANTFVATFDFSMSVVAYRDVFGKPTEEGDDNVVAPKQELSMGKYGQPDSEIAGLVNARGNGSSKKFCVPTTNAAGVSTCDYAITIDEMKEKSRNVVAAFAFFANVLDVNLDGGIPSLTIDTVRYAGVQETEVVDGKVGVRLIGVVDDWINEVQGFIVSVSNAAGDTETTYVAEKLLRRVRGGGKTYTPAQLDLGVAAYAIAIGEIPATGTTVINVTPFLVEMGDDVDADRKMGATWTITYTDGAFVKHLPDDGSVSDETEIVLDLENGNDIEGDGWQGMADYVKPANGTGTEADPYLIERPEHLAWLAWAVKDVNGAKFLSGRDETSRKVFTGLYFKQTADLDLNNQRFLPIGLKQATEDYTTRIAFGGNYDGAGFAIKNAEIRVSDYGVNDISQETYAEDYMSGIFGFVSGGSVKDVHAENVKVGKSNSSAIMQVKATTEKVAGVIVGLSINSTITNCSTDAASEAHGVFAGGIVGLAIDKTVVSYCENNAKVVGVAAAAGIVGSFEGTIDFCINNGAISAISFKRWTGVGGIAGVYTGATKDQQNSISNCINTGAMSAIEKMGGSSNNHRVALGGIIGSDNSGDAGKVAYKNLFNLADHFDAAFTASGNNNVLAASGGIIGIAEDTTANRDPATAYVNLWTVAGTTTEDHFGVSTYERIWSNEDDTPNMFKYAGITSGRNAVNQMANALGIEANNETNPGWQQLVDAAFADTYYGKTVEEIEAVAEYQAILAAFAD